ncbi:MAG TPA: hypothetical protein VE825_15835 [Terriglobales bacterium]|nr:hypothetical protein [Terriglobales bacterium]
MRMKWFALAVALLAVAGWMTPVVSAQKKGAATPKAMEDKAHKSRGAGQDPNIKHKSEANDPNAKLPKTRGSSCILEINNQTPWKVQFYADGDYTELIAPWGESRYRFSGTYTLYARADFTDNSVLTWGPRTATCEANGLVYPWTLTE